MEFLRNEPCVCGASCNIVHQTWFEYWAVESFGLRIRALGRQILAGFGREMGPEESRLFGKLRCMASHSCIN